MKTNVVAILGLSLGCTVSFGLFGCGDDSQSSSGATGGTGASASTGNTTGGSGGSGNAGNEGGAGAMSSGGDGGDGGSAGGTGGEAGFPWEGAIDPNGGPASDRLVAHPLGDTTSPQGFYEYTPAGYPSKVQWPLLIALHGIGENGNGTSELGKVLATGIPDLIEKDNWDNERPYVVLMPQHPGGGCPGADEVHDFIQWGIDNYAIDPSYVYLTGLSCGAIGSWSYLAKYLDEQIAAFVPIAGNGTGAFNNKGCDLAKVGIWAFHGDDDGQVDVSGTIGPMEGLAACPAPPAMETKSTIYPGVGHNSWNQTYDLSEGHDIYTWFLNFTHQ